MERYPSSCGQPAPAPPVSEPWVAVMCRFQAARAAEVSYDHATWRPAYRAERSGGPNIPAAVDAEMERLTEARCEAEEEVISTPAADLRGAIWKLKYARRRWDAFEEWPSDWWSKIMVDLSRLAALPDSNPSPEVAVS